jgi:hypothetical protein
MVFRLQYASFTDQMCVIYIYDTCLRRYDKYLLISIEAIKKPGLIRDRGFKAVYSLQKYSSFNIPEDGGNSIFGLIYFAK